MHFYEKGLLPTSLISPALRNRVELYFRISVLVSGDFVTSFSQWVVSGNVLLPGHSYYCSRRFFLWHRHKQCWRLWLVHQPLPLNEGVNFLTTYGEPVAGATINLCCFRPLKFLRLLLQDRLTCHNWNNDTSDTISVIMKNSLNPLDFKPMI